MGKVVVERGSIDFEPVGIKEGCGRCPSGCRTVCQRQNDIKYDIVEGEMDDFEIIPNFPDYGSFRNKKAEPPENNQKG